MHFVVNPSSSRDKGTYEREPGRGESSSRESGDSATREQEGTYRRGSLGNSGVALLGVIPLGTPDGQLSDEMSVHKDTAEFPNSSFPHLL